jgi:hypothetical protein
MRISKTFRKTVGQALGGAFVLLGAGVAYLRFRVDAAALAALKDPRRKAEVLAEIRPGTFKDAVRWAMRANYQHSKRMADADYKRVNEMAIELEFLRSVHAKDVVPEVVELTGCSVRTAQVNTVAYRKAMIEKRDRHIWSKHPRRGVGG